MCVLLDTSPWGFSVWWGGNVPTSGIDHSGPRLYRLLLHSLLIEPVSPSCPAVQFSLGRGQHNPAPPPQPSTSDLLPQGIIRPPGHHPYLYQHTKKPSSASPSHVPSIFLLLFPYLTPATPAKLLSLPLPQNLFNVSFICFSASASRHHVTKISPPFVVRLLFSYLEKKEVFVAFSIFCHQCKSHQTIFFC